MTLFSSAVFDSGLNVSRFAVAIALAIVGFGLQALSQWVATREIDDYVARIRDVASKPGSGRYQIQCVYHLTSRSCRLCASYCIVLLAVGMLRI